MDGKSTRDRCAEPSLLHASRQPLLTMRSQGKYTKEEFDAAHALFMIKKSRLSTHTLSLYR